MSGGGEQSSCRGLVDANRGPGMLAACVGTGDEACRCFYSRPATAAHSRVFLGLEPTRTEESAGGILTRIKMVWIFFDRI
jgi:hypothetical protein